MGLVLVKRGGWGFTPNLRHLWVKLVWFGRVWEDETGECSGRRCPHLRRHRWGPLAAEAWPRAPAQLGLSQGMFWREGGWGGGGGVADCSLCCGLASKASAGSYEPGQNRGAGKGEAWKERSDESEAR